MEQDAQSSRGRLKLAVGSHIKVRRTGYWHHGVYIGRGQVIHHSGWSSGMFEKGPIERTTLESFSAGSEIECVEYANSLPRSQIVENAKSKLGGAEYDLFRSNCEHFATWCVTKDARSKQVRAFLLGGLVGLQLHGLIEE